MISGAHVIICSKDAEADRLFLRDILGFPHVDAGHGWLIFGLPPAEVAVHPDDDNDRHQLYFMCDDIAELTRTLSERGVACAALHEERWGILSEVTLPGGGRLGIYEPRHPRPANPRTATRRKSAARRRKGAPRQRRKVAAQRRRKGVPRQRRPRARKQGARAR